jgi:hypothetical protein
MASWLQLAERYPKVTVYLVAIVSLLILYWPLLKLGRALRKVKWLNREITLPGSRGALPRGSDPGRTISVTQAPGTPPSPEDIGAGIRNMVTTYLKRQLFNLLLLLLLAPGCLCAYWLFAPPGFAAAFPVAFQAICGIGLAASIVLAAVLYLWLEDKLGLR